VPPYIIKIEKAATKGLKKLQPAHRRNAIEFINEHLRETPLKPIPGKIKRLRGRYQGIYQYDLSRGDRIWWRVEPESHTVYVMYIGPHPKATE